MFFLLTGSVNSTNWIVTIYKLDIFNTRSWELHDLRSKRIRYKTDMWSKSGVCTLALTVAKTSSNYDRFPMSVPARSLLLLELALPLQQDGKISGPKVPMGTRESGDISEAGFMLCIIPTLLILSFFSNSRVLQTGVLQTGPKQFVEHHIVESSLKKKHFTNWILQTGFLQTVSVPINQVPCVSSCWGEKTHTCSLQRK